MVLAAVLWTLMAWVHKAAANYSVYLVATSPKEGCGKTTLVVHVVGRLVPKPYMSGSNPTEAAIFRQADREKPTMVFDNVDRMFQQKPGIADLFLYGWSRGVGYRARRRIGGHLVPGTLRSILREGLHADRHQYSAPAARSLPVDRALAVGPGDEVIEVNPHDEALMAEFETLRRKLSRWSLDHADTLKLTKPLFPAGLIGRQRDNAKLLLAIAELAGDVWADKARLAMEKLLHEQREPAWLDLLLRELWDVFIEKGNANITSKQLLARLASDPTSVWYEFNRDRRVTERQIAVLLRRCTSVRA